MNKHAINISEQLLAKFLDGKTDAMETEHVLAYLNKNNENLEDFMNIRSATLIDSEPPIEIDLTERLDVVKQHITSSNKKTNKNRFYLITSVAAAAMVAGIVFLFIFIGSKKDNYLATDPKIDKEEIQDVSQDTIDERIVPIHPNHDKKELANHEPREKNEPIVTHTPEDNEEETEIQVQVQHRNTAKKSEANLFEMIKPTKPLHAILCKNLDKTFDFQWDTNAEKIEVTLKDRTDKILLTQEVTQNVLSIKYADYIKYKNIHWELKATFKDGKTEEKNGVLQLLTE